jgi:hypothetical protein
MSVADTVAEESPNWFLDSAFQNKLVALLINDPVTLRNCAGLLSADDFRPQKGVPDARARWIVAERALEFFEKHGEPLGKLVRSDVLEYASGLNLGSMQVNELRTYLKQLQTVNLTAPDAITEKVITFKSASIRRGVIDELIEAQNAGMLTNEKWDELMQRGQNISNSRSYTTVSFTETLENRMERRAADLRRARAPWTFIDPLDVMIRTVAPRQLGMVLAPYKRGKSSFLLWLAVAFSMQRLNVLYVTLEDPHDVVEDRLDAIITAIPSKNFLSRPKTVRNRFERYRNMIHAGIEIHDGISENVTIPYIERLITSLRGRGFIPAALIVDYDEKIISNKSFKEKRFELDDIYIGLAKLCARYHLIGWTGAQTQRNTQGLKVLSGDRVAEDIGKIRKVFCAISMGKGDWSEDSIYLWIAAHKTQRMNQGCTIIPDLERSIIYDRDATSRARKIHSAD